MTTTDPNSFVPRPYPDIVRDLLTSLTGGIVGEAVVVPAGEVVVLATLARRPVRRVSHIQGVIEVERTARDVNGNPVLDGAGKPTTETVEVDYRFTDADYELIATGAHGDELDAIRFRPNGRRPPAGSTVTVNYFPAELRPTPITDVNVGSVARTLVEAVGRELALEEQLLEQVYRSAFVGTAEGSNLDKVVALVGVTRRPPGVATTRVRFTRAAGSIGRITVPTGTVISDKAGNRYSTTGPLVIEPGEPSRDVLATALSKATPAVEADQLTNLEVLIEGIGRVTNEAAATPAATPETDDDLRRRAGGALAVSARGTLDALEYGLRAIPGVKAVTLTEFPNNVPGEIRVDVAYDRPGDAEVEAEVGRRIEELRPAGIRVIPANAAPAPVTVTVTLTLAGAGVPAGDLPALEAGVTERAVAHLRALPPGATVRQAQLVMTALSDPRIVDAAFELSLGGTAAATVTAPPGSVLQPVEPFTFRTTAEAGAAAAGATVDVDAFVPVHLMPGVTAADAQHAVELAVRGHLATLPGGQLTVDGLLAAVRDDTRYQVVRADVVVTAETADRFLQLADGLGAQPIGPTDQALLRTITVDVREGGA